MSSVERSQLELRIWNYFTFHPPNLGNADFALPPYAYPIMIMIQRFASVSVVYARKFDWSNYGGMDAPSEDLLIWPPTIALGLSRNKVISVLSIL